MDSNILLLLAIGRIDRTIISNFKRTAHFGERDFDRLVDVLDRFQAILTTPNILTEVNGFLGQFKLRPRHKVSEVFGRIIQMVEEHHVVSATARSDATFEALGLTDAGIAFLANKETVVLTDDLPLRDALVSRGVNAINFNYLRDL